MQTHFESIQFQIGEPFAIPNPADGESTLLVTHSRGLNLILYSADPEQDMAFFYQPIHVFGFTHKNVPYLSVRLANSMRLVWSFNPYGMPEENFHAWRQSEGMEIYLLLVNQRTGVLLGARLMAPVLAQGLLKTLKAEAMASYQLYYDGEAVVQTVNTLFEREDWQEVIDQIERVAPCYSDMVAPVLSLN